MARPAGPGCPRLRARECRGRSSAPRGVAREAAGHHLRGRYACGQGLRRRTAGRDPGQRHGRDARKRRTRIRARLRSTQLDSAEWAFTLLFTIEYALRLVAACRSPRRYARSFFGIVDLLAVLPSYLSLLLPGAEHLLVIRGPAPAAHLPCLQARPLPGRGQHPQPARSATAATRSPSSSERSLILVTILGTAMYLIEGEENGFTSIPVNRSTGRSSP